MAKQARGKSAMPDMETSELIFSQLKEKLGDLQEVHPTDNEAMDVEDCFSDDHYTSDSTEEDPEEQLVEEFVFSQAGHNVAIFYDDDFHIGCVTTVFSPELAEVNFLKKCAVANNTYVWPNRPEKTNVQCLFVFACDFKIVLKTTTGRVWSVPSHDDLCRKYMAYKEKYA